MNSKIAIVTSDYSPNAGGVAVYWKNLFKYLKTDNFLLIAPEKKSDFEENVIRINFSYKYFWPHWLKLLFELKNIIKQHNIKLIIAGQILPVGTVCLILKKLAILQKYQISSHGMDLAILRGWKKLLGKQILKAADKIIANSPLTVNLIKKLGVNDKKIYMVFPCPNNLSNNDSKDNDIKKVLNINSNNIIISVSRLVKRKGIDMVIEALPNIWQSIPDLYYLIIGTGADKNRLHDLVKKLPSEKQRQIIFTGFIPDDKLGSYYQIAKIFVLPTRVLKGDLEGFGIVNLEAGLFKLPVIAGTISGKTRSVLNNQTGYLINPENPIDIAEKIIYLLNNPKERDELGNNNFEYAQKFKWNNQAKIIKANTVV